MENRTDRAPGPQNPKNTENLGKLFLWRGPKIKVFMGSVSPMCACTHIKQNSTREGRQMLTKQLFYEKERS